MVKSNAGGAAGESAELPKKKEKDHHGDKQLQFSFWRRRSERQNSIIRMSVPHIITIMAVVEMDHIIIHTAVQAEAIRSRISL